MTVAEVADSAVAKYDDLVADLTRRFIGRFGAEFDDLFQEGREQVFRALRKGQHPAKEHILNGMRDYIRMLEYQTRYTRLKESSFEEHQEMLRQQEATESLPYGWDTMTGGLDYVESSESELYS